MPDPCPDRAHARPDVSRVLAAAVLLLLVVGCSPGVAADQPQNILVLIADDLGVDMLAVYGAGGDLPPTPNLDALAARGVVFRNVWANPTCSPSRATMLTGRYSFRTGIGVPITRDSAALSPDEITIPEVLDVYAPRHYRHAYIGKWHLGNGRNGGDLAPNVAGFSHYAGSLSGVWNAPGISYSRWPRVEDGHGLYVTGYNTSATVDDALAWIRADPDADGGGGNDGEPWFCMVGFSAPHKPFHAPPAALHHVALPAAPPEREPRPYYEAMVEAMDTEIGRLLDGLGQQLERTTVIFLADNGTPSDVLLDPLERSRGKHTLYESGVRVPLIIAGPAVRAPGREVSGLVNTTDIFATVLELAGVDLAAALPGTTLDARSVAPVLADADAPPARRTAFAEIFSPNGSGTDYHHRAIRDERFKLIDTGERQELYDLLADPGETTDLLAGGAPSAEATRARDELSGALTALVGPPPR